MDDGLALVLGSFRSGSSSMGGFLVSKQQQRGMRGLSPTRAAASFPYSAEFSRKVSLVLLGATSRGSCRKPTRPEWRL